MKTQTLNNRKTQQRQPNTHKHSNIKLTSKATMHKQRHKQETRYIKQNISKITRTINKENGRSQKQIAIKLRNAKQNRRE